VRRGIHQTLDFIGSKFFIKSVAVISIALVGFTGCSSLRSDQVKTLPDGTRIESHQRVTTFWDSHSSVAKLRASTSDKTQGLTLAGLEQESSSTNATELLRAVGTILQNLPK
jgi:hypothetical protein